MFTFRGEGERARGVAERTMRAEAEKSKHRTHLKWSYPRVVHGTLYNKSMFFSLFVKFVI